MSELDTLGPRRALARCAIVAAILGALASSAHAALISIDLAAPGDDLITRDTGSGLDWLDLTVTTGYSQNDIEADVGGWLSAGWRYATGAEVCGLFNSLGHASSPCPEPSPGASVPLEFPVSGTIVQNHLDFLGTTWFRQTDGVDHSYAIGNFDNGDEIGDFLFDRAVVERQEYTRIEIDRGRADVWTRYSGGPGITHATRNERIGHYLVRAVAPEPVAWALLLVGGSLLLLVRAVTTPIV